MKRREPGAAVLGLGFSGVGALHSLAELSPRPAVILGIDHNPRELGFASRVGPMRVAPPPWADEGRALRDFLLAIVRELGCRLVLYPCGDDYVQFLSAHRESLAPECLFLLPPASALEVLMNKGAFAEHARDLGLSSPRGGVVLAEPGLRLPTGVDFPVVAKSMTSLKADPFWGVLRVKRFDAAAEWDAFFGPFSGRGLRVVTQELIPGGDEQQFVYEGFWDPQGEERSGFTVRKLRQEPPGYGSSCRAVCVQVPELLELSRRLLSSLSYHGLADVDFKRDARNGRMCVMEVNPRLGGLNRIGRSCGIDLVHYQYLALAGEPLPRRVQGPGVHGHWAHFSKDLRGLLPVLPHQPGLLGPWIRSYFPLPMDALFTWSDRGPYGASMRRLFRAVMREAFRRLRRVGHRDAAVGKVISPSPENGDFDFR